MKLLIINYLQQKEEAPSKMGFGLNETESWLKEKRKCFILTSDRVSKEWSASAYWIEFSVENVS
jgi:hypothetical protein